MIQSILEIIGSFGLGVLTGYGLTAGLHKLWTVVTAYPRTEFQEFLEHTCACDEARRWVGRKTPEEAWRTCYTAHWMIWALQRAMPTGELPKRFPEFFCTSDSLRHRLSPEEFGTLVRTALRKREDLT